MTQAESSYGPESVHYLLVVLRFTPNEVFFPSIKHAGELDTPTPAQQMHNRRNWPHEPAHKLAGDTHSDVTAVQHVANRIAATR